MIIRRRSCLTKARARSSNSLLQGSLDEVIIRDILSRGGEHSPNIAVAGLPETVCDDPEPSPDSRRRASATAQWSSHPLVDASPSDIPTEGLRSGYNAVVAMEGALRATSILNRSTARIHLASASPLSKRLRRASNLRGDRTDRLPLGGVLTLVIEDHPNCPLSHLLGKSASVCHAPILSRNRVGCPGAIHFSPVGTSCHHVGG